MEAVRVEPDGILLSALSDKDRLQHAACEISKRKAIRHPTIRTLVNAVSNFDCDFDIERNVSCHKCIPNVIAGFNPDDNHIILCQNSCHNPGILRVNLGHELVHLFDHCRAKIDFTNLNHLACTEIRAANLMNCRSSSLSNKKLGHKDCVRARALRSVHLQTGANLKKAESAVDNVFDQCYSDMSPFSNGFVPRDPQPGLIYSTKRNYTYY